MPNFPTKRKEIYLYFNCTHSIRYGQHICVCVGRLSVQKEAGPQGSYYRHVGLKMGIPSMPDSLRQVIVFNWVSTENSILCLGNYGNRLSLYGLRLLIKLITICWWGILARNDTKGNQAENK